MKTKRSVVSLLEWRSDSVGLVRIRHSEIWRLSEICSRRRQRSRMRMTRGLSMMRGISRRERARRMGRGSWMVQGGVDRMGKAHCWMRRARSAFARYPTNCCFFFVILICCFLSAFETFYYHVVARQAPVRSIQARPSPPFDVHRRVS